jgi:hypothetical protein
MTWLERFFADRDDYGVFLTRAGYILIAWAWILTGMIWAFGFLSLTTDWLPKPVENAGAALSIGALLVTFLVSRLIIAEKNRLQRTS